MRGTPTAYGTQAAENTVVSAGDAKARRLRTHPAKAIRSRNAACGLHHLDHAAMTPANGEQSHRSRDRTSLSIKNRYELRSPCDVFGVSGAQLDPELKFPLACGHSNREIKARTFGKQRSAASTPKPPSSCQLPSHRVLPGKLRSIRSDRGEVGTMTDVAMAAC